MKDALIFQQAFRCNGKNVKHLVYVSLESEDFPSADSPNMKLSGDDNIIPLEDLDITISSGELYKWRVDCVPDVVMCFYLLVRIYSVSSVPVSRVFLFISFCLMELGRTPYDLLEGESELVSRYNIEFGRFGFTLLFLGEYSGFFWILG